MTPGRLRLGTMPSSSPRSAPRRQSATPLRPPPQQLLLPLRLREQNRISGIPVIDRTSGKLVGILTNRDVRFVQSSERPGGTELAS